ncbi:MAG: hypothetical protein C6Y22_22230 [Hapalosiphonaceae cyanobacterium JJU2]|nr:MAG: hypothetical protein C6Y22_22230 [Hapalosiphonaceae cyanobacterium JJU2]
MIIDLSTRRLIHDCFSLVIPVCEDDSEFIELMNNAYIVQQSVTSMLNGSISPDDLIQSVESFIPSIDEYIDEVESNLNECQTLLIL